MTTWVTWPRDDAFGPLRLPATAMRILVVAAAAPLPPRTGFTLVVEAILAELRQEHDVHVVAYRLPEQTGETPSDTVLVPFRRPPWPTIIARMLRGRPRFIASIGPDLRPTVKEAIESHAPQGILAFSARLADLGAMRGSIPTAIVPLDAVHLAIETRRATKRGPHRLLLGIDGWLVRRFERRAYRLFDRVVVVSERDRDALLALDPNLAVEVIANGVDIGKFAPDPQVERDRLRIIFTGVMDSPGNIAAAGFAAREILPLVRSRVPGAYLAIVGRDPAPSVSALATEDGVIVTGEVPDIRPWLSGSRVFLCPMVSGTGIKNKLLEAMAVGLPCVSTRLGLGGLEVEPGVDLLVGADAASLADALVRVLSDDVLAQALGSAGRRYVERHHRWSDVALRYASLLDATATDRGDRLRT